MSILLNLVLVILLVSLLLETMFPLAPASRELRLKALVSLSLVVAAVLAVHTSLISIEYGSFKQTINEYMGSNGNGVIGDRYLRSEPKSN